MIRGHEQTVELSSKVHSTTDDAIRLQLSGQINRRNFGVTPISVHRSMFSDHVKLDLELLMSRD